MLQNLCRMHWQWHTLGYTAKKIGGDSKLMTYLIFRSQTEALKAHRLLQGAGVHGSMTKPPRDGHYGSCAYAVRIPERELEIAKQRLRETNFAPYRVRTYSN